MDHLTINNTQVDLYATAQKTRDYIANSKSEATRRVYQTAWKAFDEWCAASGLQALPSSPQTVALYLSHMTESHKVSTICKNLTAISQAHEAAGFENPLRSALVRTTMAGIKRTMGTAPHQKQAAVVSDVARMVQILPDNLLGIRDRSLLLLGFAGAFRRSELVSLDVEDLEWTADGLKVNLRKSKTDQEGKGSKKGIPYGRNMDTCPVEAVRSWLEVTGSTSGAIFRSVNKHGQLQDGRLTSQTVALVVKRAAKAAGLDSKNYSGHSLRSGLATSAAMAGVEERHIMKQTGHHSVQMIRRYIREGELFLNNAAGRVGL